MKRSLPRTDNGLLIAVFKTQMKRQEKLTRRIAITIAFMMNATPRSIVQRCEELGLVANGSWDFFKASGGITNAQIEDVVTTLRRSNPMSDGAP